MIYLDHHAATPLAPGVGEVMREAERIAWANPSSVHTAGRAAKRVLEHARGQVAESIGSDPNDIVFTAGGTEACNLGVLGIVGATCTRIVTTRLEHPAVRGALTAWAERGASLIHLEPSVAAAETLEQLERLLHEPTDLVAIQWVNHETGTCLPVADYANICRSAGVPLFVDATQAWGKLPMDVSTLGATALAIAGHKAGGPAGTGALWVQRGVALHARALGGGQERGRRAGSPAPTLLAGFGAAADQIPQRLAAMGAIGGRRDRLERDAVKLGGIVNGDNLGHGRVATATNLSFKGRTGAALVAALDLEGVCCSSGAACSSGLNEPSPVLRALYPAEPWRAESALRFSFGPEVSDIEVESVVASLRKVLARPAA